MITIYCLLDPRTNSLFYVGATVCALSTRLSGHIVTARQYIKNPPFRTDTISGDKHRLIIELVSNGLKPDIMELARVIDEMADHCEKLFYEVFTQQGYRMLQLPSAFQYYEKRMKIFDNYQQNNG